MNIQIFGTSKSRDTQKCQRFFKERGIRFQFIDLAEKEISRGELTSIRKCVPLEELVDTESREYEKRGLKHLDFDLEEELLTHPQLLKMPIVRDKDKATCGFRPEIWDAWIKSEK